MGRTSQAWKILREGPRHDQAVLEHVGDAAGSADVVFEHQVVAGLGIAHQVDAGDVRVDAAGHLHADHLALEVLAGEDQRARNLAVLEDALRAVDVLIRCVLPPVSGGIIKKPSAPSCARSFGIMPSIVSLSRKRIRTHSPSVRGREVKSTACKRFRVAELPDEVNAFHLTKLDQHDIARCIQQLKLAVGDERLPRHSR